MPAEQAVELTIDTLRNDGSTEEREKRTFPASRHEVNGKIYLRYKEVIAEGESAVPTMLIIENTDLRLHRKGQYGGDMNFLLGRRSELNYRTPMGVVPMAIDTSGLDLFISDEKIEINLKYSLSAGDQNPINVVMQIIASCI